MKKFMVFILSTLAVSIAGQILEYNQTCVDQKLDELRVSVLNKFETITRLRMIRAARMMSYNDRSAEILLLDFRGDLRRNRYLSSKQTLHITNHHHIVDEDGLGGPYVDTVGRVEDISNVLMMDVHESGQTAMLLLDEWNEQYLMVNTTNSRTSCTLRLSMYSHHGRVLTDDVFGVFKFSPDGKYLMYVAESQVDPKQKFLYRGSFGETVDGAIRPIVILYEVSSLTFHKINHVPKHYSLGQLSWRPDSSGIVGVGWQNHPFPSGCPVCANRESQIITTNLANDNRGDAQFLVLTRTGKHVYAPRLTPDGSTLIYLENDLKTNDGQGQSDYFVTPGMREVSRRLMRMNFVDAVSVVRRVGNLPTNVEFGETLVQQVYHPYIQPDGTLFSGLYPKLPLPERCFSHNGAIFYLTIYAKDTLRLVAIDIYTSQVTFHPEKDISLLDVTNDAILVVHGSLSQSQSLRYGSLHSDESDTYISATTPKQSSTTSRTTRRTSTRSTTTKFPGDSTETTTFGYPTTTIYDPCEHMLQEINDGSGGSWINGVWDDGTGGHGGHGGGGGSGGLYRPTTTTTNPFTVPLPIVGIRFYNLTAYELLDVDYQTLDFEVETDSTSQRRTMKQASRSTQDFNAIYAAPKNLTEDSNVPLLVDIHGGPEKLATTGFQHRAVTFVELGYAVLMINYRGSVGNGDAILQSLLGNIAKNEVEDCHLAINLTLSMKPELSKSKIALIGEGFGGFVAAHLNINYPGLYQVLALTNPVTDLSTMASHSEIPEWSFNLFGMNYTNMSLSSDLDYLAKKTSPLAKVDQIKGKLLFMVGEKDKTVVPRPQGIALFRALRNRHLENATEIENASMSMQFYNSTQLYLYPETGHYIKSLAITSHMHTKTIQWVNFHWSTYLEECPLIPQERTSLFGDQIGKSASAIVQDGRRSLQDRTSGGGRGRGQKRNPGWDSANHQRGN